MPHTAFATATATDPTTGAVRRSAGEMQAYSLRQLAFDLAREVGLAPEGQLSDALKVRASAVTGLIRAWAEADERARIARGRPLPGSLRPERRSKPARQRRAPTPSTTVAPSATPVEQSQQS